MMKDISISLFSFIRSEELQLALNNILFRAVLDAMPCGVLAFRAVRNEKNEIVEFVCFFANNVSGKYIDKEIVGKKLSEHPTDAISKELYQQVKSIDKPYSEFEYSILRGGLEARLRFEIVRLQDGVLILCSAIENYADDRGEKSMQNSAIEELKDQSHFIRSIAEAMPDILFVLELRTNKIVYVNHAVERLLGYTDDQILAMKEPLFELMAEEDIPAVREHLEKMKQAQDGDVHEIEYRLRDVFGNIRWFCDRNTIFKRDSEGNAIEKIGISQDITKRKESEEELRKQHNVLKQSEELARIGSWEYDIATRYFHCSDGMYALLGLDINFTLNPAFYLDYASSQDLDKAKKIVENIQHSFQPTEETLRFVHGNINKVIRVKASPLKNRKNETEKMIGVNMDITDIKQAEAKISDLNKNLTVKFRELETLNSELQTFNTIAANDYKETLSNLYTNFEFIISREGRNLSDVGKANLRRAQSAIQKLNLLTDDIIAFSNINVTNHEVGPVDLNAILEAVLSNLREKLIFSHAIVEMDKFPEINGYPILLSLLFQHLLDNSIKFRKSSSKLTIQIKYDMVENLHDLKFSVGGKYHKISIVDNGVGFAPDEEKNIFVMFYRLNEKGKFKGSGIGLSICKKIMDLHHGFIVALGKPNESAVFSCYFPIG